MRKPKSFLLKELIRIFQSEHQNRDSKSSLKIPDKNGYSRRTFIETGAKGAAAIVLASSFPLLTGCDSSNTEEKKKQHSKDNDKRPHIAIVGAGIAGLHCAYILQKAGISSTVYEASKRPGGRILTHYNNTMGINIFPEFGGDFIDSSHADMLNLAKEFNLELIDLEKEKTDKNLKSEVFFFGNRNISEKEIIKEFSKIANKINSDIQSLGENYDTPAAELLDNTPLSKYIESLACAKWLKNILNASFTAEYGLDCSEQSTLNFLDMINPDTSAGFQVFGDSDERYRIKGGNSKIIEALHKNLGDDVIKMNHHLISIEDVTNKKYQLTFDNNQKVIADYVILAIPFTILRNINMNIKSMTTEKKKAINELGMGINTKLVLAYEGSPWKEAPNLASGRVCQEEISNGWDGGYNKDPRNPYGVYVCYFGGTPSQKLSDISYKNPMAPPTHVWRTELPEKTVKRLSKQMDQSFPGSDQKFMNKHVFVNWIDYPYTKGSYSCYKTGQWTTIAGNEITPLDNVYFAGEHCSRDFQGFMNGGAETGRFAAEEILKAIG
ncbi:MAG: NAD(P)/FAD-dependent oxidoreductase [Ginsengibacter sp.]